MGGVLLLKKWKMGVFFCKKSGPFLNAGCIMYSISIFYFTYLGKCIDTQHTPCLWAWFLLTTT